MAFTIYTDRNLPTLPALLQRGGKAAQTAQGTRMTRPEDLSHGPLATTTVSVPDPMVRRDLIDQLVRTKVAGEVATLREDNRFNYYALSQGDRYRWFGLEFGDRWTSTKAVLAVMAERCGVIADPSHLDGQDTIDPELTVRGLERAAVRLYRAAAEKQRVLFATGHPGGLLDIHRKTAASLRAAGCEIMTIPSGLKADEGTVVQFCDVAMYDAGANLEHTHSAAPMAAILDALEARGETMPDLVVADHGWAGCAAQRGIDTIGYADSNDPALFLAEVEDKMSVTIPLDDHLDPRSYDPLTAYLLSFANLPPQL